MAALLSDMRFGAGPFGGHGYAEALAAEAVRLDSAPVRRPASPPQPVPQPWRGQAAASTPVDWAEALEVAASPASSDATEQFLDCQSEPISVRSSFESESELLARGMQARLSVPETLAAAAAAVAPCAPVATSGAAAAASSTSTAPAASTSGPLAAGGISLQQERQRRLAAEAAVVTLRQQLDDISAALFSFRSSQGLAATGSSGQSSSSCGSSAGGPAEGARVAAQVASALLAAATQCQLATEEAAAQRQRADAAEAAAAAAGKCASDAAYVARLVAGICTRAAVAADLESSFAAERASLERRLQQATRMGHAMLKHSKEAEPEPWKQQLLNTVVSVGCSILGAATAVLIIRRSQV
ncbi:hypothetical protein C2E21_4679 [Chlorella sorokiniana]|uniref:Uncharacterized protein n=1 Tax=Chlorella sorokiniana TaxID=3076 RepID=A0A2P6TQT7_CHLSO|nr:hypothetical protein C2E21_4679 [Chlorella sorokiniana]|eukprot:PRW56429.1 hypothetical protein C2E21_4679 [Chlorella sorokiniana]